MDQWHDFFLAQAGAAGVLTGLVFVGVSINLQKIVSEPGSGLTGRAAEALIVLVVLCTGGRRFKAGSTPTELSVRKAR
jgi:hypothetical protein